jgi:metal-responsive CopG/Arc/MetJ family transcriptional regulator
LKTAISLPDDLSQRGEQFARQTNTNRSELYAVALREYLERHQDEVITAQLNALYTDLDSGLAPELEGPGSEALHRAQRDA